MSVYGGKCLQHEGLGYDALISSHGGVAKCRWNIPRTREVCSRDPEDHDHTYGIEPEAIE